MFTVCMGLSESRVQYFQNPVVYHGLSFTHWKLPCKWIPHFKTPQVYIYIPMKYPVISPWDTYINHHEIQTKCFHHAIIKLQWNKTKNNNHKLVIHILCVYIYILYTHPFPKRNKHKNRKHMKKYIMLVACIYICIYIYTDR